MTTRNFFETAADAVVATYTLLDRPAVNFMDLLAVKGHLPVGKNQGIVERSIRNVFDAIGAAADKAVDGIAAWDREEIGFFDLLAANNLLPLNDARVLALVHANDNVTGGERVA